MFGFGGPNLKYAKKLADEFMHYKEIMNNVDNHNAMAARVEKIVNEIYIDEMEKMCSWYSEKHLMAYNVQFEFTARNRKSLMAEGKERNYGIIICASDNSSKIAVNIIPENIGCTKNAYKLQKLLISFPQFYDADDSISMFS